MVNMEKNRTDEASQQSWNYDLGFNEVPNFQVLRFVLAEIEASIGREISHKHRIAELLISFYEGRQEILENEYSSYGNILERFKPPPVFIFNSASVSKKFAAGYNFERKVILLN